jgi:hypothetical protein
LDGAQSQYRVVVIFSEILILFASLDIYLGLLYHCILDKEICPFCVNKMHVYKKEQNEIIGGCRKPPNEGLHSLRSSPNDRVQDYTMARACITHGNEEECMQVFWRERQGQRDH